MAGLSLAWYISQSPLKDRSILILDKETKTRNDRTWCFWERGRGPFESILYRTWDTVEFYGTTYQGTLDMGDYRYKMLRGIDFYAFMQQELQRHPALEFRQASVDRIRDTPQGGFVITEDETYMADYVFDSTYALRLNEPEHHNLLQHFKGWVVRTERPCFDPARPRMMDFRIDQHGDCRFVYVLPFDEYSALIEYTIFNDRLLPDSEYDESIRQYISRFLFTGAYEITETEFGVIPMSDVPAPENPSEHIVRIGTSGGYTKPSTGYTFQRTQRYLQELVRSLQETGRPVRTNDRLWSGFKRLQDSILLNVLENKRYGAADFFTRLYVRNPPAQVFRFLDEDTTLTEDLRIMSTVPLLPFTVAALDVLRKRLF